MADMKREPGGKPLIYFPTVDHGDMERPSPEYEGDQKDNKDSNRDQGKAPDGKPA